MKCVFPSVSFSYTTLSRLESGGKDRQAFGVVNRFHYYEKNWFSSGLRYVQHIRRTERPIRWCVNCKALFGSKQQELGRKLIVSSSEFYLRNPSGSSACRLDMLAMTLAFEKRTRENLIVSLKCISTTLSIFVPIKVTWKRCTWHALFRITITI